jgi:hypothetical protein
MDMDKDVDEYLRSIAKRHYVRKDRSSKLSDVLGNVMNQAVRPKYEKVGPLKQLWGELLPAGLANHCRIDEVAAGGVLRVAVDSKAYEQELRWCSGELLAEIQKKCPRARVKSIKFFIDS